MILAIGDQRVSAGQALSALAVCVTAQEGSGHGLAGLGAWGF